MKKVLILGMIVSVLFFALNAWANDRATDRANQKAYFDVATGHKYLKNLDGSYTEISKKGVILRNDVPNDLPLLTRGKYIREIDTRSWLLYEKTSGLSVKRQILPASYDHPGGWQCEKILISLNQTKTQNPSAHGYSKTAASVQYDGRHLTAVGPAYFDTATCHRYIKNSDNTYAEYSRKGELLRTNVPNTCVLLTSGKYIFDLADQDYILYERRKDGETIQKLLTAGCAHPEGWYPKAVYASIH